MVSNYCKFLQFMYLKQECVLGKTCQNYSHFFIRNIFSNAVVVVSVKMFNLDNKEINSNTRFIQLIERTSNSSNMPHDSNELFFDDCARPKTILMAFVQFSQNSRSFFDMILLFMAYEWLSDDEMETFIAQVVHKK